MRKPKRRKVISSEIASDYRPPKLGGLLLDLRDALTTAEHCRRVLSQQEFTRDRWLEIIRDVDPDLRFVARPQLLDAIVTSLQSAGKPLSRRALARDLAMQKVGSLEHIQKAISINLRVGKLARFPGNMIGLLEWEKTHD